jgi:hypothetical protein
LFGFFVVLSPFNFGRFVENEGLAWFTPIVVVNIRYWFINGEVLSSGFVIVVNIDNWFFVVGSPLLIVGGD